MAKRISEIELILPSLYLMSLNNGRITTTQLIKKLRTVMNPSGEDLETLSGRSDDKFSQKVRNLKAHDTFERFGYAEYKGGARGGYFEITASGQEHLTKNVAILRYLLANDFSYSDIKKNLETVEERKDAGIIETFDENVVIEGYKKIAESGVYQRSAKLRDYAVEHFTKDGKIYCDCCAFSFEDFYGKTIGRGFIEIHHVKPIFKYENEDLEKIISEAIKNVLPVCSNCHRMIHRSWNKPLEIQYLKEHIRINGVYAGTRIFQ